MGDPGPLIESGLQRLQPPLHPPPAPDPRPFCFQFPLTVEQQPILTASPPRPAQLAHRGPAQFIFPVSPCRKLKSWWQKLRLGSRRRKAGDASRAGLAPWEADYELLPCEGLFHEYLEMGRSHVGSHTLTLKALPPLHPCGGDRGGPRSAEIWKGAGGGAAEKNGKAWRPLGQLWGSPRALTPPKALQDPM
jgi:hypothetical protein